MLPLTINQALVNLNIEKLNEMQESAIQHIGIDREVVLLSPTGSGKTLAFLLPLLKLLDPKVEGVQTLILTPSRELALQIESVFKAMNTGLKVNCCYGGHSMKIEKNNLSTPPSVLVGTPGRIVDHLKNERFKTTTIQTVILDEFDKSLEFGFQEDMEHIIQELNYVKYRILVSATSPDEIPEFTQIQNPKTLNFLVDEVPEAMTIKGVRANEGEEKIDALINLLSKIGNESTIVFCNHRDAVDRISKLLKDSKVNHGVFHGGMKQEHRERELIKFRNGTIRILLATDLAARGLDIPEVKSVVHYQIPPKEDAYIHRNGRTARMMATGEVYVLLGEKDFLPKYIVSDTPVESVPPAKEMPANPLWSTLYLDKGKKDKINKMDIVGLFFKKGKIQKDDLGLIVVQDYCAYIAVKSSVAHKMVKKLQEERVKNKKIKLSISH